MIMLLQYACSENKRGGRYAVRPPKRMLENAVCRFRTETVTYPRKEPFKGHTSQEERTRAEEAAGDRGHKEVAGQQ